MMKKNWSVVLSNQAKKAVLGKPKKALPEYAIGALKALIMDIECFGPTLGLNGKNWPHFGRLRRDTYHCHLPKSRDPKKQGSKKGADAWYVVCWRLEDEKVKIVEVYYVGTHENAPY